MEAINLTGDLFAGYWVICFEKTFWILAVMWCIIQFSFTVSLLLVTGLVLSQRKFVKWYYINVLLHATSSGVVHWTSSFNKQSLSALSVQASSVSQLLWMCHTNLKECLPLSDSFVDKWKLCASELGFRTYSKKKNIFSKIFSFFGIWVWC